MKIARKDVLKAIRTEKLRAGSFISGRIRADGKLVEDSRCKVCAVGAVLRQAGIPSEDIDNQAYNVLTLESDWDDNGDEFKQLKDGNYLAALSVKFEKLAAKNGGVDPKTKSSLRNFVRRYFPKQFNMVGQ